MDQRSEFPKDGRGVRPSDEGRPDGEKVRAQTGEPGPHREGDEMDAENTNRPNVSVKDRRKLRTGAEHSSSDHTGTDGAPVVEGADEGDSASGVDQLSQAKAEAASHLDDLRRLKADFDNYRKRVLREQTALAEAASGSMVARLLAVLDNFDLAISAAEETQDFAKMLKGVEMVYGELKEVLRAEGLEFIEAKGKPFDPNRHEAALEVPGDDSGRLVVSEVLRPGYLFKGRVLRPAMVKVTQKKDG